MLLIPISSAICTFYVDISKTIPMFVFSYTFLSWTDFSFRHFEDNFKTDNLYVEIVRIEVRKGFCLFYSWIGLLIFVLFSIIDEL